MLGHISKLIFHSINQSYITSYEYYAHLHIYLLQFQIRLSRLLWLLKCKFNKFTSLLQAIVVDPATGTITANADFRKQGAVDGFQALNSQQLFCITRVKRLNKAFLPLTFLVNFTSFKQHKVCFSSQLKLCYSFYFPLLKKINITSFSNIYILRYRFFQKYVEHLSF